MSADEPIKTLSDSSLTVSHSQIPLMGNTLLEGGSGLLKNVFRKKKNEESEAFFCNSVSV